MAWRAHTVTFGFLLAVACDGTSTATLDRGTDNADVQEGNGALQGDNSAGENLGGVNLGANNLAGNNLAGVNLGGTNLAGNNLAGTNLAGTNLGGNNLGGNNLAATNLAATNLAGNNLAGTNLAGTNLAATNLSGSSVAGLTPLHGAPVTGTTLTTTAVTFGATGAGVNIHRAATVNGMLSSGEDLYSRAASCVVLGVGSTAFSRLVVDNGAGPMFGALKKSAWGFANPWTGSMLSEAWELVAWGPSRYCVFIIAVPPGTSFQGVRGFVKAIFRWNAAPGMSMTIGELGAATTPAIYTGMMGAAAKFADGTIDDTTLLAGELAFATATTNNITVQVDFAAWVRTKAGGKLILGNVGLGPTGVLPPYLEGVYSAAQIPNDGIMIHMSNAGKGTSSLGDYESSARPAYLAWLNGFQIDRPVSKRCLFNRDFANESGYEAVAPGKCDQYTTYFLDGQAKQYTNDVIGPWYTTETRSAGPTWASVLGAAAVLPHNNLMTLPETLDFYDSSTDTHTSETILSETFVTLNEAPTTTCTPESDVAFCTRLNAPASCIYDFTAADNCNTNRSVRCGCATAPAVGANEVEPNGIPAQATLLTLGTPMSRSSYSSEDKDWFRVVVAPGNTVTLSATCEWFDVFMDGPTPGTYTQLTSSSVGASAQYGISGSSNTSLYLRIRPTTLRCRASNQTVQATAVAETPTPSLSSYDFLFSPGNRLPNRTGFATLVVSLAHAWTGPTVLTLANSAPGVLSAPTTVTVPAGSSTVGIPIPIVGLGSATVTATVGGKSSSLTFTVVPECTMMAACAGKAAGTVATLSCSTAQVTCPSTLSPSASTLAATTSNTAKESGSFASQASPVQVVATSSSVLSFNLAPMTATNWSTLGGTAAGTGAASFQVYRYDPIVGRALLVGSTVSAATSQTVSSSAPAGTAFYIVPYTTTSFANWYARVTY